MKALTAGSLYAGIGAADLAVEHALGAEPSWQLDLVGGDVRRRHWPGVLQVEADVRRVDPSDLPRVDILVAGFSCKDLSFAGKGDSRHQLRKGRHTGPTWDGVVRFVGELEPELVVLENTPALLAHVEVVEEELGPYGWTWVRCGAWDVGAPHIRRRAFGIGVRGGQGIEVIDAPTGGRWRPETVERTWATPTTGGRSKGRRGPGAGGGSVPYDEALQGQVRTWASPGASDHRRGSDPPRRTPRGGSESLTGQVQLWEQTRTWPTTTTRDANAAGSRSGKNAAHDGISLVDALRPDRDGTPGRGQRISSDWAETLMGLPTGWTRTSGPSQREEALELLAHPRWPRGRYPKTWDRTQYWPGYDWEPPRTLPDGPPVRGRPARLEGLGNAWVPHQGALAVATATR